MALAVIVAMVLISSASAQCTPSTCPDGPVLVVFEYANCTGSYQFYPSYAQPGCHGGEGVTVTDSELVYYDVNNLQCDLSLANASYEVLGFRFGVCGQAITKRDAKDEMMKFGDPSAVVARTLALSAVKDVQLARGVSTESLYNGMMYLANVNASFSAAPQPYFQYNPSFPSSNVSPTSCYSADNCTTSDGSSLQYYETHYQYDNCAGGATSVIYPVDTSACYNYYNQSYRKFHCTEEHTFSYTYHYGDSCDAPSSYFTFVRAVCSSDSRLTLYCLASPPSNPTTEPSSSANLFLLDSSIITFFCIIASLIAFS